MIPGQKLPEWTDLTAEGRERESTTLALGDYLLECRAVLDGWMWSLTAPITGDYPAACHAGGTAKNPEDARRLALDALMSHLKSLVEQAQAIRGK
jgi:hypothetical protein